jgi:DNA-binding GntR family transcriptional regulator
VVEQLRGDIVSGRLAPGVRVTEAELCKRFGVGRGPVREAVQQLAQQRLLVTRPNCGAMVAPEAPEGIRGLIVPIRRTIELYALEMVFDDLKLADFERWEAIVSKMKTACQEQDFHSVAELDLAFHRALLDRADQADLLVIWDTLVSRIRSHFRRAQRRIASLMDVYEEHRDILESFRKGNLRDASKMLRDNIT